MDVARVRQLGPKLDPFLEGLDDYFAHEDTRPSLLATAVILAGGLGTRLRRVVADRPKVLAEIQGRPFLEFLLDHLEAAGFERVVLCTGVQAALVQDVFGNRHGRLQIGYSEETSPLGTGGALRLAVPLLGSDPVLVMNGDSYCQADLAAFAGFHQAKQAEATLLLTQVPDVGRFGQVRVDEQSRVIGFEEKGGSGAGWINAGIYLLSQTLVREIPQGRAVSLEREMFPAWIGRNLFGWQEGGRFIDIGTPESYEAAEQFFRTEG